VEGQRKETVMQIVATSVARMEADLKSWGAKLHRLRLQGHAAGSEPNLDYHKRIDDMAAKCEAAGTKLDELKTAGSTKWESLRSGIDTAWSEVEAAFRRLAN
jgi:hypothetical protein